MTKVSAGLSPADFSGFFERNVMQYDYRKNKVHFVGSIAWYFSDILKEVAARKRNSGRED